jgi:hypothetical protein
MNKSVQKKIYSWWHKNQYCFMLPAMYGGHEHDWIFLEAGCVGCRLCGVVHICQERCNIIPCCRERQDDSSEVCLLTGIVLSTTTFFESEISILDFKSDSYTNMQKPAKKIKVSHEVSQQVISDTTHAMMDLLLFSDKAKLAKEMERKRYKKKIAAAFSKHVSGQRYKFNQYNVIEGIEFAMSAVSKYRKIKPITSTVSKAETDEIKKVIIEFVSKLVLPKPYVLCHQTEKLNNLITSIIYICSDGICYNGTTYLKRFSVLKKVLPLELTLLSCFKIQPKIVTDGENIIKMCINDMISRKK